MVGFIEAIKTKKYLEKIALKVSHMKMGLKDLKTVLKPIAGIHKLSDLNLDV